MCGKALLNNFGGPKLQSHALLKEESKGKFDKGRHEMATGPRMLSMEWGQ